MSMNNNHIIHIEIEGNKHTLYFGMRAVIIFEQKCYEENLRINNGSLFDDDGEIKKDLRDIDEIKLFCYCIYAGLCNEADRKDDMFPDFSFAYDLANEIIETKDAELQNNIWSAFRNSRAGSQYFDKLKELSEIKGHREEKKKTQEVV